MPSYKYNFMCFSKLSDPEDSMSTSFGKGVQQLLYGYLQGSMAASNVPTTWMN